MLGYVAAKGLHALHFVEVEKEEEVGLIDEPPGHGVVVAKVFHRLALRHPAQEVGVGIGHHDVGLLAQCTQISLPCQRGAERIAIGGVVAANHNVATLLDVAHQCHEVGRLKQAGERKRNIHWGS